MEIRVLGTLDVRMCCVSVVPSAPKPRQVLALLALRADQYMLALHRSGRRGEALEVYQRLRVTLVRELGMEPSASLRRLQRSILVAAPERAEAGGEPAVAVRRAEQPGGAGRFTRVG